MPMDKPKKPGALTAKGGQGYTARIPSPRQSYDVEARSRSIMMRPEMGMSEQPPMIRPGMSQEEIDMYNKPQMDINDAFFGPDNGERFDIVEFLANILRGGNR